MKISQNEREAVLQVIQAGRIHGYVNMIAHLVTALAREMIEAHGMNEESARSSAQFIRGYPFAMQDDLIGNGMFDETGRTYKAPVSRPAETESLI